MARQVAFHGRVIVAPGAYVFVDDTGMLRPNLSLSNIGAVIGTAEKGQPDTLYVFSTGEEARQTLGAGSLADAVALLFEPSNDERVPSGAAFVYAMVVNEITTAIRYLVHDPVSGVLSGSVVAASNPVYPSPAYVDVDLGATYAENAFEGVIISIVSGWGKGQQRRVNASEDQGAFVHRFFLDEEIEWEQVPFLATVTTTAAVKIPTHVVQAVEPGIEGMGNSLNLDRDPSNATKNWRVRSKFGTVEEVRPYALQRGSRLLPHAFLSLDPTGGGPLIQWTDPQNWIFPQAQDGGNPAEGTTAGGTATNTVLNGATNPLTANLHRNRWLIITAVNPGQAGQASLLGRVFQIQENTAATVTLYGEGLGTSLSGVNLNGLDWKIISIAQGWIEIEGSEGEAKTLTIRTKDNGAAAVNLYYSTALNKIPTLAELSRKLSGVPGLRFTFNTGVDTQFKTVDLDYGPATENYGRQAVSLLNAGTLVGATSFVVSSSGGSEGSDPFPIVPFALLIDEGLATEEILLVSNNNTGTETLTTSAAVFAHAGGSVIKAILSPNAKIPKGSQLLVGPGDNSLTIEREPLLALNFAVQQSALNAFARLSITRYSQTVSSTSFGGFPLSGQAGGANAEEMLNIFGSLWGASIKDPLLLHVEGKPSWERGFALLRTVEEIKAEVPVLTKPPSSWDWDGFVDLINDHIRFCEEERAERHLFLGMPFPLKAGTFRGQAFSRGLLDYIRIFNAPPIAVTGQESLVPTSRGTEEYLPPWSMAAQAAGVFLGTDAGEGLTFKFVTARDVRSPFGDWNPADKSDNRDAILGGLLFAVQKRNRWRIQRGNTTFIANDNLAKTDINVWEIRNLIKKGLREWLEDRFIGAGIATNTEGVRNVAPASVASVREAIVTYLAEQRAEGYIVDSQDPKTGQIINAWKGLSVKLSGDLFRLAVSIFPKTATNFMLLDMGLEIPQFGL